MAGLAEQLLDALGMIPGSEEETEGFSVFSSGSVGAVLQTQHYLDVECYQYAGSYCFDMCATQERGKRAPGAATLMVDADTFIEALNDLLDKAKAEVAQSIADSAGDQEEGAGDDTEG